MHIKSPTFKVKRGKICLAKCVAIVYQIGCKEYNEYLMKEIPKITMATKVMMAKINLLQNSNKLSCLNTNKASSSFSLFALNNDK